VDRCDECGFVYDELPVADVPRALRSFGERYGALLRSADEAELRTRPQPETWSPLEYACHVRDVFEVQRQRLARALEEDCPTFVPMGREERVTALAYNEQPPTEVADALAGRAEELADAVAALDEAQLARTGVYGWPVEAERTMAWVGRHTVHEGEHHLDDIRRGLVSCG
jgi:hypothetical protein